MGVERGQRVIACFMVYGECDVFYGGLRKKGKGRGVDSASVRVEDCLEGR